MATLFTDTFPAASGAWDSAKWPTTYAEAPVSASQASGVGRFNLDAGFKSLRLHAASPGADRGVLFRQRFPNATAIGFFRVFLRSDGVTEPTDTTYTKNTYWVEASRAGTTVSLLRMVNSAGTTLNSAAVTAQGTAWTWWRFETQGTTLRWKRWADGSTEPAGWTVTLTDTSLASGSMALGSGYDSEDVEFSNLTFYDFTTGRPVVGTAPLGVGTSASARRVARAVATSGLGGTSQATARTIRPRSGVTGLGVSTREARPTRVTAATGLGLGAVAAVRQARPAGPVHTALGLGTPADTRKAARPISSTALPAGTSASTAKHARPSLRTAVAAVVEAAARYLRPVRERAAPAFPALAVRLVTPRRDLFITGDLLDLSYRSVVPGGFASGTFPLARPLTLDPDELAMFARLYVYDTRTGETAWEGRLEDPGRSADSNGQVWDLTAIGPSVHTRDDARQLVYIERSWERFLRLFTNVRPATNQVEDYSGPTSAGEPSLSLQFPNGTSLAASSAGNPGGSIANMRYQLLREAGQRLARFNYRHIEGRTHANYRVQSWARVSGGPQTLVRDEPFSTTETGQNFATMGVEFPADRDILELRITWNATTATTVAGDDTWCDFGGFYLMGQRFRRDGTVETAYSPSQVYADSIVTDLLVRLCPQYDALGALIEETLYAIPQLVYQEAVTAEQVLTDLMELEPAFFWAAWESGPTGKHRFEWRAWPQYVTYEADTSGGYSGRGSGAELYNRVQVRWRDARGYLKFTEVTQSVPVLDDAGLVRSGPPIDLTDQTGDLANAQRVGAGFLAKHRDPPNAGTLTINAPITDLTLNRLVDPWSIRPGRLIRVRGISPRLDSLNATDRDGVSVFRIIAVNFSQGSQSATLELDAHPPGVARALAAGRAAQGRKRA